jgi:N-acetylglucosaminyldiphosphoundecaprenol N-acetyl-beta-D-mannosaminyltransferase|tara:strand:- start:123 stop:845 length:723 start_codon:yes stop_codon:yes gene_type:complete
MIKIKKFKFFKIKFMDGDFKDIKFLLDKGGLLVLPAAPALANIYSDKSYHKALKHADIALFDSGFFCLLLRIFKGIKIKKYSGLKFLTQFLKSLKNCSDKILMINPSYNEQLLNKKYLKLKKINNSNHYVAPFYNKNIINDLKLLKMIKKDKPRYIVINLGGGVQELLGSYLKYNLDYKPSIVCSGAAIAFLTGQQAKIPSIFDKLYLGWLIRIMFNPFIFIPRYIKAFKLFFLMKYIQK